MNDFFQRQSPKPPPQLLNPNQGLRMLHAPPLLPNAKGKKASPPPILSDAPLKLHIPNRTHNSRDQLSSEELTVNNLRKLYSTLLEEMAPLHHEIGSTGDNNANYRWKNSGTVTVSGTDDDGYDYSFTPDDSKKSWRLQRSAPGGTGGITGGDWDRDGIRRYYTGGTIEHGGGGKKNSSNVISVGGMNVDVGVMDGVELSPKKKTNVGGNDDELDRNKFSIDEDDDDEDGQNDTTTNENDVQEDLDVAPSASSFEEVALESTVVDDNAPSSTVEPNNDNVASNEDNGILFGSSNNMTTFESMYHLSPSMAWRLRSAYSPTTPQEEHLLSLGSEILAQRHPEKADGIMKGLEVARNCEARVCDGLRRIGELISYCERLKGAKFVVKEGRKFGHGSESATVSTSLDEEELSSEEDEEELEAAEAVFAYFCEKNVLPMLIDSLLCRPPPLTSMEVDTTDNMVLPSITTTIGDSPSPFSGVTWTAAVKAQILQTMSMVLFNTSSPLSLTYLLSNNYMNELIMGILPLDQWKKDSLEEILPPYISLLRGLVLRLRGDEGRSCLPLFLCQRQRHGNTTHAADSDESKETYLPILYAAVQVFCSPQSSLRDSEGCLVRTTAMNVILNLCRITDDEVRSVLVQGSDGADGLTLPSTKSAPPFPSPSLLSHPLTVEQELLFPHICQSLKAWYLRSVRLAMASLSLTKNGKPNVDEAKAEARARHKDLAKGLFSELQYWFGFLDDLLSCEIRAWNARLVEWFLREVVVGTVLIQWIQSVEVIERCGTDADVIKVSPEVLRARAEARIAVVFFTQLFSMIEYSPLVRLVATLVLNHKYPCQWCGSDDMHISFSKEKGFFLVTPAINAMISKQSNTNADPIAARTKEEADAGAGGRHHSVGSNESSESRGSEVSEDVELDLNEVSADLVPSLHRAALLKMLAGEGYSPEETVLASMLFATVLENDAIDDAALEIFGVLPSSQLSPFEASIAQCLAQDCWTNEIDSSLICQTSATLECVSTLGLMLIERIIFHSWTEGGQCLDSVPFCHCYNSSQFVQALGTLINKLASKAQLHVPEVEINTLKEIGSDLIRKRYSSTPMDVESPRSHEGSVRMTCSLQSLYPSNFIDNACVLTELSSQSRSDTSGGDLHLVNIDDESVKFALHMTLHLRSVLGCIQDLKDRVTNNQHSSRWHGEDGDDNLLSLRTTEEADDILLSIGGIQTTLLPEVGTDIDLRGRTAFKCSLPRKTIFGRKKVEDIVIDTDGVKIVVTERANLVLVVDPSEIYVAQTKKDANRCLVLAMIPLKTIIASATEAETLHVVCNTKDMGQQVDMLRNGTLSLTFPAASTCTSAKECLDKYCTSNEKKILMDMSDWLEKCTIMGASHMNSTAQTNENEDSFCDFQS